LIHFYKRNMLKFGAKSLQLLNSSSRSSTRLFSHFQSNARNGLNMSVRRYGLERIDLSKHMSTFESMYFKVISLPPVHYIEDTLASIHDATGLPWGLTIVISTSIMRLLLTLPAHITQQKVMAKRYVMSEEMKKEILPSLQRATNRQVLVNKWNKSKAEASYRRVAGQIHRQKVQEYNCHAAKMFLPMYIQIPAWIFTSVAIRNIATMRHSHERSMLSPVEERYLQMSSEGPLWCYNLSVPDPTLILPILVGVTFASTIFISSNKLKHGTVPQPVSKFSRGISIFLYSISMLMVPLASFQPSALALYWAVSGAMGVSINLLLMSPSFRRAVRIADRLCICR